MTTFNQKFQISNQILRKTQYLVFINDIFEYISIYQQILQGILKIFPECFKTIFAFCFVRALKSLTRILTTA